MKTKPNGAEQASAPTLAAAPSTGPDENRPTAVEVPDHRLVRPIGRGSYGEVWLAQNMMGRYRAVKIVWRAAFKDERPFERELSGIRRFEPISRSHEGFVDVLQVGMNEKQGCFYYVMELGDDQTNGQDIKPEGYRPRTLASDISVHGRLTLDDCLRLGEALTDALTALHKHDLVHRDIKPSNIIFVNGVPKLADIGLVAEVGDAVSYVGTEGFIPPEGPSTAQADIYALGKVLYEAATGNDRQSFPELPVEWAKAAGSEGFLELNEVILRACESEAGKRYGSAWEMRAELLLVANGKSVQRMRMLERRWSNVKRVAGVAGLVMGLAGALLYPVYREHQIALVSRERQIGSDLAYGNQAMGSGDLMGALPSLVDAMRLDEDNAARQALHRLRVGSVLAQCPKLARMWSLPLQVDWAEFSPNGQQVILAELSGQAQVFDSESGKPVTPPFDGAKGLCQGSFSPDGSLIVTACRFDHSASLWRIRDRTRIFSLSHPDRVLSATFSPDGHRIVTGCDDGIARLWNVEEGTEECKLRGHTDAVAYATYSPDGRLIATASRDGTARIWDASDGHPVGQPLQHPTWVRYVSFSPDGQIVATGCFDHKARLWETATGRRIPPDLEHHDGVVSVEFSPDGRLILTAGLDRVARLWLADNHHPLDPNPILRHSDRLKHATFCSDGHRILTCCIDGTVRIWDLAGGRVAPRSARRLLSEDGSHFLTLNEDRLQVWDTLSGRPVSPIITPGYPVREARLDRKGAFALVTTTPPENSGSGDHQPTVSVWEAATGNRMGPPLVTTNALSATALSADATRLLGFSGTVARIWDTRRGVAIVDRVIPDGNIGYAGFSPSGYTVASFSANVVRVWDGNTGQDLFAPLKHSVPVVHIEFDSTGSRLVTCTADPGFTKCQAQVWDIATGRPVGGPLKHEDGVLWATFSPDGSRIATASEDFTAAVWDPATSRRVTGYPNHEHQVLSVAFSPDGRLIVTASADQSARVWNPETGDPLTPPLRHVKNASLASFLSDNRGIVTCNAAGDSWIWTLSADQRPVQDFVSLAKLLSSETSTRSGEIDHQKAESVIKSWERMRRQYPSDFAASTDEVEAWHEFQAEISETQEAWSAVVFHLGRLLSLRPADQTLADRLVQARAHVKTARPD